MREHFKERINSTKVFSMDPPLPANLNIEVNNTCNHNCVFCPYHGSYTPRKIAPAVLDVSFVKDLLKQAWSLGIGRNEVGFYLSGEPLLYKELVDVTAYAKELGFPYIFMTTNGALASPDKMKALIDAGLNSIRFSVNSPYHDSYSDIHGHDDLEAVVNNIRFVHEYITDNKLSVATAVSCVLTKETNGCQKDLISLLGDYVDDIAFIPVMLGRLAQNVECRKKYELIPTDNLKINPQYVCSILFNTMYINAFGEVIPCCAAYDDGTCFTDLKKDCDLLSAWHSDDYRRFRSIFLEGGSDKGTICEHCYVRMQSFDNIITDFE